MDDSLRTQFPQDVISEADEPEELQPRRGCTISTMVLIAMATVVSALASVAGGLVMYFHGLEALEDTVRDSSASEIHSMMSKMEGQLSKTADSALTLKQFVYSNEQVKSSNSSEWAALVRAFAYAQVANSPGLYDSTMSLTPYDSTDPSAFYAGVWGDVTRNGSRELVYGAYGDYLGSDKFVVENGELKAMWIPSYSLHAGTGYINKFVYDWDGKPRYSDDSFDPRDGPVTRESPEYRWTDVPVAGSVCSRWWNRRRWYASDGNMYAYAELEAIYVPPPPPHPWSGYKSVSMFVGLVYSSFQPPYEQYRAAHPDTHLLLVERESGAIYASTEGGMIPEWCQVNVTTDNQDVALACSLHVSNLSQAIQEGHAYLQSKPAGTFSRTKLDGEEYFVRRHVASSALDLVWLRPASSVDGKVQEALTYLIIFTVIVLAFDASISLAEIVFIALPMKRLADAICAVAHMKTDEAAESLRAIGNSPLKEVTVMHSATSLLVENVSEYKTFLPQAILDTPDEAPELGHQRDAPGKGGKAAIVFTDIRGSTQLWEACHSGMSAGLRMHNDIIRRCISDHDGYEVKTIGDAFMVAFDTADEAVMFALAVHDRLAKASWPEDLLREPLCARDEANDWCGIRIRVGVTYGPVTTEANAVTKRCDYFGPTVNRAARLEGACAGGAVMLEDTLVSHLAVSTVAQAMVIQMGARGLKGIADPVSVSLMVPKTLSKRAHPLMQDALKREKQQQLLMAEDVNSAPSSDSTRRKYRKNSRGEALRVAEKLTMVGQATTGQITQMFDVPERDMPLVNHLLTSTMSALERTDGSVLTVSGGCIVIGWNTLKPCHTHVESSFRFTGLVMRSLASRMRCSLSTGPMHTGYVGSQGQRFVTAVGACSANALVSLSAMQGLGVNLLYSSSDQDTIDALCERCYLRPVETRTVGQSRVLLHEINRKKVEEWCDDKLMPLLGHSRLPEDEEASSAAVLKPWGRAYCKAYEKQDFAALSDLADLDGVVAGVMERLRYASRQ